VFHHADRAEHHDPEPRRPKFSATAADSQSSVEIHVLQGERKMAGDNKSIGRFHLDGIPPAPRGVPQIEVPSTSTPNGILHVSAKDLGTGREQRITITASSGLNQDEIKNMVKDAESHSEDDRKRREAAETHNIAENTVYQTEKLLKEHGAKVSKDKKALVEKALESVKEAIKSNDADAMKAALDSLNNDVQALSSELYSQARSSGAAGAQPGAGKEAGPESGPGPGPGEGAAGGKKDGDVIDADFEMMDDDKKKK